MIGNLISMLALDVIILCLQLCAEIVVEILFAWTNRVPPGTPLVGEARAAILAALEACVLNYPLIVFEGDNL